ncbi:MAG: hypothetical protein QXZ06_07980 [Candidatus Jordarchaeales archaeon]
MSKINSKNFELDKARRGGISIDDLEKLEWLSDTYGNSYRHPRTHEKIRFVSETRRSTQGYSTLKLRLADKKHYIGLPRVAYHRQQNRPCSAKLIVSEDGDKFVDPTTVKVGKPTKQWAAVYQLTKRGGGFRKYNYWSYERYNFDFSLENEERLAERCNYLAKQLMAKDKQ